VSGIFLGQFASPIAVAPLTAATGVAGAFGWTGAATIAASLLAGTADFVAARSSRSRVTHHEEEENMIVHGNRFTFKDGVSAEQIEEALESLRNQGRSIPAVKSCTAGRDHGGELEWGATFVIEDLDGYWEYLTHPCHMRTDRIGLPLLDRFASFDITDDLDAEMGAKIAALHQRRYDQDAELTRLVSGLGEYTGSAVPGPHGNK
jgi:hypothetical protein